MRQRTRVFAPYLLSRRDALKGMSSVVAIGPLSSVIGCAGGDPIGGPNTSTGGTTTGGAAGTTGSGGTGGTSTSGAPTTTGTGTGTATTGMPSTTGDGGMAADASTTGGSDVTGGGDAASVDAGGDSGPSPVTGWASGGTASMTGIDSYPDPFAGSSPTDCALFASLTLGPCYDPLGPEREDITDGLPGLPMRFAVRVLDANCQPVTDADVDIWQCDTAGVYSGNPSGLFASICTGGDAEAMSSLWFRGHQSTDEGGVAWFNSCFPGWYTGRALHTHFTIRRPGYGGDEYLTSQLAFPDDLTQEIFGSHPDYVENGPPDTLNAADGVFPGDYTPFVVQTERMTDGALLAYKTIILGS